MIYSCLPIKTIYHKHDTVEDDTTSTEVFELFVESAESGNKVTDPSGGIIPQVSIVILHKSIPGLDIPSFCREVAAEARFILQTKLQSISSGPLQIIVNSFAFNSLDIRVYCAACVAQSADRPKMLG
jgi:hypothetical protein